MDYIINSVLCELEYQPQQVFSYSYQDKPLSVSPFCATTAESQVFLVLPISEGQLKGLQLDDFLPVLASHFRKTDFYCSDMDKNTSLVFCVKQTETDNSFSMAKIKIEDDPYYFKKYVFDYTAQEEESFIQSKKEQNSLTYVEFIQKCISDTNAFARFKENPVNEPLYSCAVELATKLPLIPIEIQTSHELRSVRSYTNELLEKERIAEAVPTLDKIVALLESPQQEDLVVMANTIADIWSEYVGN